MKKVKDLMLHTPSIIPMLIVVLSFAVLYSIVEIVVDPMVIIKATGHQWYQSALLHEGG